MTLQRIVALSSATAGRDKVLRLLQYVSRFGAAFLLSRPKLLRAASEMAQRLDLLDKAVGDGRKAFRLLKSLHEVDKIPRKLSAGGGAATVALGVGGSAALALFLAHDNMVWLVKHKILRGVEINTMKRRAGMFWFCGLSCALLLELPKAAAGAAPAGQAEGEEARKRRRARAASRMNSLRLALDLSMAVHMARPGQGTLSNVNAGIIGTASSLLGLIPLWAKTRQ